MKVKPLKNISEDYGKRTDLTPILARTNLG
jgi:hypothetical protein